MAVTPTPGTNVVITSGGVSVVAIPANPNGGYITNPLSAADQNLGSSEPLYIDPTGANPTLGAYGSTFALQPGQTWQIIPGQSTTTKANATTSGHRFTAVYY